MYCVLFVQWRFWLIDSRIYCIFNYDSWFLHSIETINEYRRNWSTWFFTKLNIFNGPVQKEGDLPWLHIRIVCILRFDHFFVLFLISTKYDLPLYLSAVWKIKRSLTKFHLIWEGHSTECTEISTKKSYAMGIPYLNG